MRKFLIALAAAVLLAGLATPAAGQKTQPSGEIVPSTNEEIPFVRAQQAPEDYPGWTGWNDCVVTAAVEVTSNVNSQLYHRLTGPGEGEVWTETVSLKKTDPEDFHLVMLNLLVRDQLGEEFLVDYSAELSTRSGPFAWLGTEEEPVTQSVTCEEPQPPLPTLTWITERAGKNWTATVWAFAFAFSDVYDPIVNPFSMEGQFTPDPLALDDDGCGVIDDPRFEDDPWECKWTAQFGKKTDTVTFEVIDPPVPACDPIEISLGGEGTVPC